MQSTYSGGHTVSRVKRWARALDRSTSNVTSNSSSNYSLGPGSSATWQEVLRRYCLLTRMGIPVTEEQLGEKEWGLMSDDMAAIQVG
jgi:hypothetical protein